MKFYPIMKKVILVLSAILMLAFFSCDIPIITPTPTPPPNNPPTVTLTADDYTLWSDQTVTLTASATDADGDPITYQWYVNSVLQSAVSSSVTYTHRTSISGTVIIQVVVSDGFGGTDSDSVSLYYTAASSLHVTNSSSYPITLLNVDPHSSSSWGSNQLTSSIASGTSSFKLLGIPYNQYDFRVYVSTLGYAYLTAGYYMYTGEYRTLTATNSGISISISYLSPNTSTMSAVEEAGVNVPQYDFQEITGGNQGSAK